MVSGNLVIGHEAIIEAAIRNASGARHTPSADFGVGFASGLLEVKGIFYSMVWCAVVAKTDHIGLGGGLCVRLSKELVDKFESGKLTEMDLENQIEEIDDNPYEILVRQALLDIQQQTTGLS